ncbi:hypothetical protein MKEN_01371400 [Mycena kentingensis (nom. inval.)]|nr:hypothetical protein MKEN_01371400 [Mycena kentingensis (nom. inval.)]
MLTHSHYFTEPELDVVVDPLSIPVASPSKRPSLAPRTVIDLTSLDLDQIAFAFDCDSDSDNEASGSGSDDGYVSTLLKLQRSIPVVQAPRKIAGTRRVARAVSSPAVVAARDNGMDVEIQQHQRSATPEGELFQSITATPGLETTSFEELRLETYMQSLISTGARPPPAYTPATTIPPAFSPYFCEWEPEDSARDVEMITASSSTTPCVFRSSSFP